MNGSGVFEGFGEFPRILGSHLRWGGGAGVAPGRYASEFGQLPLFLGHGSFFLEITLPIQT